jgi:hypothetical protein
MKQWEVTFPEHGWTLTVEAVDAGAAAEKGARKFDTDSADYVVLSDGEADCTVRQAGEDKEETYTVHGESVPMYTAQQKRVKDVHPSDCKGCPDCGAVMGDATYAVMMEAFKQ